MYLLHLVQNKMAIDVMYFGKERGNILEDIYRILDITRHFKGKAALATIIHVEGSAYLKEGSMILIMEDGTIIGMISGGCLEEDLTIRAGEVMKSRTPQTICYETKAEDDLSWGNGCNGTIYILIEPLDDKMLHHLRKLSEKLDAGIPVLHNKILTHNFKRLHSLFISDDLQSFGDECPDYFQSFCENIKSGIEFNESLQVPIFNHLFTPKPRLIIFGGGYDARPLTTFAIEVGFSVVVCDWRPAYCQNHFFPPTTQIILGFPEELVEKVNVTQNDFIIIMTHQFQKDQQLLSLLTTKEFRYLGLLGAKQRAKKLTQLTGIQTKVYSPIGIPIGANGPKEIAISIVAEMIQVLRSTVKNDEK